MNNNKNSSTFLKDINICPSYLNWILFLKKIKYKVKAEARVSFTYMESMKQVHTIAVRNITKLPMPIDLYKAYGAYHYGIFS